MTEIVIKAEIRHDITSQENAVLDFVFNDMCELPIDDLPIHPFFELERWFIVGSTSSTSHIPWVVNNYDGEYLFSRSCVDNHDKKAELLFDWLCEIVHCTEAFGHTYATRLQNEFVVWKGTKPWISLPKGTGIKLNLPQNRVVQINNTKQRGSVGAHKITNN